MAASSVPPNSERFLEPYRQAVARFGAGFQATLWSTPEAQRLRFDVMIDEAGFEPGCTILDAGCGLGDLAARLLERNVPFGDYLGVDAIAEMIEQARRRSLPRCRFQVMDLLHPGPVSPPPDYVCISGTINTMDEPAAQSLVQWSFSLARRAVLFNFLSTCHHPRWTGHDTGPARRFDPVAWLAWSLARTSRVTLTQDYLDGHDATIVLRHESAAP